MRYLFIPLVLALLALVWRADKEKFSIKNKITFLVIVFGFGFGGYFLSQSIIDNNDSDRTLSEHFMQGGNLLCGNLDVNNSRFNYSFTITSFIAKPQFAELNGVIVSVKKCKIK